MRTLLFCILFTLVAATCLAGQYPMDERPMYGPEERSWSQLQAEKKFISETLAQGMTREQGAKAEADVAWMALVDGNISESMRRFNKSWLLDQDYFVPYWGFAILLHIRDDDTEEAAAMFEKAISLAPDNGDVIIDYGRMWQEKEQPERAIPLFEKGVKLSPNNKTAYVGLMLCYGMIRDFKKLYYWSREGSRRGLIPEQTKEGAAEIINEILNESETPEKEKTAP